jgi:phage gp16-like protein
MKRQPADEDYVEWLDDEQKRKFIRILGVSYLLDS